MPQILHDLNPAYKMVADALGEPGRRTFFLQGQQGLTTVTVAIEKFQAQALAQGIDELLDQVGGPSTASTSELHLSEPLDPVFRAGQIGLGYDERRDRVVIVVYEVAETEDADPDTLNAVRFWITREQARALAIHAVRVCAGGRPSCPLCGNPLDPDGHFCPKRNGH